MADILKYAREITKVIESAPQNKRAKFLTPCSSSVSGGESNILKPEHPLKHSVWLFLEGLLLECCF